MLLLAIALAGCASAPAPIVSAPAADAPPRREQPGQAAPTRAEPAPPPALLAAFAALSRAGAPDAPSPEDAEAFFGPADVDRREGQGGLMTYRLPSCALLLSFVDAGAGLRLTAAQAGVRRPGMAPAPLDVCVAEAVARQAPGP